MLTALAIALAMTSLAEQVEVHDWLDDAQTVLVIGDSHMNGSFGRRLHESLTAPGDARVVTVGSCGRWANAWVDGLRAHCGLRTIAPDGTSAWGKGCKLNPCTRADGPECKETACRTPTIDELVDAHEPALTIVNLGGNSMFRGTASDGWRNIRPYIRAVAESIHDGGSACLWVSPAHGLNKSRRKMKRFVAFLDDTVGDLCTVWDSGPHRLDYLDYRKAAEESGVTEDVHDGIHYDRLGKAGRRRTRRWAEDVTKDALAVLTDVRVQRDRARSWGARVALDSLRLMLSGPVASADSAADPAGG